MCISCNTVSSHFCIDIPCKYCKDTTDHRPKCVHVCVCEWTMSVEMISNLNLLWNFLHEKRWISMHFICVTTNINPFHKCHAIFFLYFSTFFFSKWICRLRAFDGFDINLRVRPYVRYIWYWLNLPFVCRSPSRCAMCMCSLLEFAANATGVDASSRSTPLKHRSKWKISIASRIVTALDNIFIFINFFFVPFAPFNRSEFHLDYCTALDSTTTKPTKKKKQMFRTSSPSLTNLTRFPSAVGLHGIKTSEYCWPLMKKLRISANGFLGSEKQNEKNMCNRCVMWWCPYGTLNVCVCLPSTNK